mmetsp:Transcript_21748/g.33188  ORF Transcript_21748/g.33188 Transcript_21748/m.33188 type:complete len:455 (+) Transcript_21748:210-1574(+)
MNMMYDKGKRPSSVDISDEDNRTVASDITFQSAVRSISMERLLQLMKNQGAAQEHSTEPSSHRPSMNEDEGLCSGARVELSPDYPPPRAIVADHPNPNHRQDQSNTNRLGGIATRRYTSPPAWSPKPPDHIDVIIELKLQVAQQKETIDCLTSDLNHALSENKALLSKANQPAKPMFSLASLAEEKAHSDNSRSLHQQYNELREEMNRLQKSMDLQQEKMAAVEADNRSLTKERNRLQSQLDRMSCKMTDIPSSDLRESEQSGSVDFTANLTESSGFFSGLSGCELIPPPVQSRRASAVDQTQDKIAHNSYLPWSKVKRRYSEPVYSHEQQQGKTTPRDVEFFASPKKDKNEWFIGDESENSFLSKMVYGRDGSKVVEKEDMQVHRRSSMPDKLTPTSSPYQRRRSCASASKRSDVVVHESYRNYVQSEKTTNGGDFNSIVWGDSDSDSNDEFC